MSADRWALTGVRDETIQHTSLCARPVTVWHRSGRTVPGRQDRERFPLVAPHRFATRTGPATRPQPAGAPTPEPTTAPAPTPTAGPGPATRTGADRSALSAPSAPSADRPRETR